MQQRLAIAAVVLGGGALAWWLSRDEDAGGIYAPIDLGGGGADPAAPGAQTDDFLQRLSRAEDPTQDPWAKNPYSTASGLYQFTRQTWTGLGGDWGDDPSKAFGGLRPSAAEQTARAARLTNANASILDKIGLGISNATLYAVHILGAPTASRVLPDLILSDPTTPLTAYLPGKTVANNPALGTTAGSFIDYLTRKVGF